MQIVVDFETSVAPKHLPWNGGYIVCLAAIIPETKVERFWVINHEEVQAETQGDTISHIQDFFTSLSEDDTVIAHNAKFEVHWLRALGIDCSRFRVYCTQIAEYTLNGQARNNSLQAVSGRYGFAGKSDLVGKYWASGYETDEIPIKTLKAYNIRDCWQTYRVYQAQQERITPFNTRLLDMEMQTLLHLATIEQNGMVVDASRLRHYAEEYGDRLSAIDGRLKCLLHPDANFGSPEQVSYCLFGRSEDVGRKEGVQAKRGSKATSGTLKSGALVCNGLWNPKELTFLTPNKKQGVYCTDKATISQLPTTNHIQKEVKQLLLERTNIKKQLTTYFNGMQEFIVQGKIHCSMNQAFTRTGRLSSSSPNLQNITRGSSSPVKECFASEYTDG